jgi:Tfp pilus assembly protein PilN
MDARKLLAIGTGVSLEVVGPDLVAAVVRVRPSGVKILGCLTIPDYAGRPAAEWGAEYSDFMRRLGVSHLAATMLLPRSEVIVRQVAFPGVSPKDLGPAVQLQIDSLHPYGEDEVSYAWARLGDTSSVLIGIARKSVIERYSQLLTEAGLKIAAFIFSAAAMYSAVRIHTQPPTGGFLALSGAPEAEAYGESAAKPLFSAVLDLPAERAAALAAAELRLSPEAQPVQMSDLLPKPKSAPEDFDFSRRALAYATALAGACPWLAPKANLLPAELRSSSSRLLFLPTAMLVVALLLMAVLFATQSGYQERQQLAVIQNEIAKLQPSADKALSLRQSSDTARARILTLDRFRARTNADLETLNALTKLIEPPAWLQNLEMDGESVLLSGETEQAAPLLKLLDSSPYLKDSEFTGPIGRTGKLESFRIRTAREWGQQ